MQPHRHNEPFLTSDQFIHQQQAGQPLPQAYSQPKPQPQITHLHFQRDMLAPTLSDEQYQQYQTETQSSGADMQGGVTHGNHEFSSSQHQIQVQAQPQVEVYVPPVQRVVAQPTTMIVQQMPPANPGMSTEVKGTMPGEFWCLGCNKTQTSETQLRVGKGAWATAIAAISIAVCTSWCCLGFAAPLPFCLDCAKDTIHHCPQCQREVGRQNFLLN